MSKIFEALQKTSGDVADLTLPLVTPRPAAEADQTGGSTLVEDIVRDTAPISAEVAAVIALPCTAEPAAPPEPVFEPEETAPEVARNERGIREVSLRLLAESPILPFDADHARAGEQYRVARTKILQHPQQPRLVVISSTGSGDGKTITSINLAGAMALKSEGHVLLVDGDMRRSQIGKLLGIPQAPGLADVLGGACALEDAIVQAKQFPNLFVLPGGKPIANPTELLDSSLWTSLCATVRQQFKFVIFDAPPMATVADYDLIQSSCDGVVLVVRPDHTNREMCLKALESVPKDRLVGVVMNCVRDWFLWKTPDRYYYAGG
jgi:capsular exopolysaccharide synthesis family protein